MYGGTCVRLGPVQRQARRKLARPSHSQTGQTKCRLLKILTFIMERFRYGCLILSFSTLLANSVMYDFEDVIETGNVLFASAKPLKELT